MERRDQGGQLVLRDILQLVDEQHRGSAPLTRRSTDRTDEIAEVGVEVAAVGQPPLRVDIECEF